jgi:carboxymethylenebutenolidase
MDLNKSPIRTSEPRLKAGAKDAQAFLAEPENGGPGILLLHAWWGLTPFFKDLCVRLAEHGFVALAPDLKDGQIAGTIGEAKALDEALDLQFVKQVVLAAQDYLLSLPGRKGRRIGVVGFSLGAFLSLVTADSAPDKFAATVLFYGAGPAEFGKLKSKFLGHFSDVDEWAPYDEVKAMQQQMQAAGLDVKFHVYAGRPHWFVEEDRPEYDAEAAGLAWERTYDFLNKNL